MTLRGHELAHAGRLDEAAAHFTQADEPISAFNRYVLEPEGVDTVALRNALPSHLADLTNVAPSSMTHRLDKLAERGLIERTPDAANRTRVYVSLTDEGWQLFSLAIRGSDVVESDVLQDLSDAERGELARMLEVVIARLDDVDA